MKKILLLFSFIILLSGCSPEDNNVNSHLQLLPVENATFPESFVINEVYEIPISFVLPTTCHIFEGFYYEKDLNTRTIAVQTVVIEQNNCMPTSGSPVTQILKFKPTEYGSYIFKLWKGKGPNGEDVFEEVEVPVQE